MQRCQKCGERLPEDSFVCSKCGAEYSLICPNCEKGNLEGTAYCYYCGKRLEGLRPDGNSVEKPLQDEPDNQAGITFTDNSFEQQECPSECELHPGQTGIDDVSEPPPQEEFMPRQEKVGRPFFLDFVVNVFTVYKKYSKKEGRATRKELCMFLLFQAIVILGVCLVYPLWEYPEILFFHVFWGLANLLPFLAVVIRRMHDVGLSGWFLVPLLVIPYFSPVFLLALCLVRSSTKDNKYGPHVTE